MKAYERFLKAQNSDINYLITGKDTQGKRFKIYTKTPWHYNIFQGSIWLLDKNDKKVKLIKRIYN
jgi:hypothetical protein